MTRVPVSDGKPCTFNVVRVCGTWAKAMEEAIRRARISILSAIDHSRTTSQSCDALEKLFVGDTDGQVQHNDAQMDEVDLSDDRDSSG